MKMTLLNLLTAAEFFKSDLFKIIIAAVAVLIILIVVLVIVKKTRKKAYFVRDELMNEVEVEYFYTLESILPDGYRVFPHVNLKDIIGKKSGEDEEIASNYANFVICDNDFSPVACIKLENRKSNAQVDGNNKKSIYFICKKAGLPIISIGIKEGISEDQLKNELEEKLMLDERE